VKARLGRGRIPLYKRGGYALIGLAGYILSPASWWNDALVNIPLAMAMAVVLERLLGVPLDAGFVASYWATNVLGVVLMALGYSGVKNGRPRRRDVIVGLVLATLYTVLVVQVLRLLGA